MTHDTSLHALRRALDDMQSRQIALPDFCAAWRSHPDLLAALPARYRTALDDLLGRLEAAAPFAESCCCTLNHGDLLADLGRWLEKAREALAAKPA